MAQQYIVEGMSGSAALSVLNENFTELYNALTPPIVITDMAESTNVIFPYPAFITLILITYQGGNATINIGLTPNGQEILGDYEVLANTPIQAQQFVDGTLYFTFVSGTGSINAYIYYLNNVV